MTESEWQTCTDPQRMLDFLQRKASDRKLRLFAVACCYSVWNLLSQKRMRKVVKLCELFADGLATDEEFRDAVEATGRPGANSPPRRWSDKQLTLWYMAWTAARACCCDSGETLRDAIRESTWAISEVRSIAEVACHLCDLLRDIFGLNPTRTITICSECLAWNDATVPKFAQVIYDDRAFDRLPILADALEESGCNNADILDHCRQPGEHVRGCWVIDLILGKR